MKLGPDFTPLSLLSSSVMRGFSLEPDFTGTVPALSLVRAEICSTY